MEKTGNAGSTNKAGAAYGTGYCDGQCARDLKWVNGKANSEGWTPNTADPYNNSGEGNMGACCAEMDLWEANLVSTAFTPHPAENPGLKVCMGDEGCGRQDGDRFIAPTDRDGCDINAYRMGHQQFYGPGPEFEVNTMQPFTVVTRFHAPDGELIGIEQFYVQNGQEIHHPNSPGLGNKNIETDETCQLQKNGFGDRNRFAEMGGMKVMGEALDRGMVLVISLWDDIAVSMNWLDSYMGDDPNAPGALRGPCDPSDGKPEILREKHPEASYTVNNIKWGDFGTTTGVADVVV
jgi:cellulose 1,4-beta-cellobiosidase